MAATVIRVLAALDMDLSIIPRRKTGFDDDAMVEATSEQMKITELRLLQKLC